MRLVPLLLLLVLPLQAATPIDEMSLTELEQRLKAIDSELDDLASNSMISGVGPLGYRSVTHKEGRQTEWIQIDLEQDVPIDEIVIVPTIWRDTKVGFRDDGFPLEFQILVGSKDDEEGTVVASFTEEDKLLPRTAPLVVPCPGTTASWVRIEATLLSPRAWDQLHVLQLSEVLVFSGEMNVALQKSVTQSSRPQDNGPARDKQYLVDGFVPYLMDAAQGSQSIAFVSTVSENENPIIGIDLGSPQTINQIHIHGPDLSDTVPQTTPVEFGVPRHFVVEGSLHSDFSEAVTLIKYRMESPYDTGPIIMRHFPETTCRYIRLVSLEPFIGQTSRISGPQIALAEIEVFSNGKNVALGSSATCNLDVIAPERSILALTDGRNLYGEILSIRTWMNELARRHDLEVERPKIVRALDIRHDRQKTLVNRLTWLVVLMALGVVLVILIDRIVRMRHIAKIRERLAADLHDELGANLHTIGLLSDLAAEAGDSPEQLATLHRRIRSETERSGLAVRHCTDMLEAVGVSSDFEEDMQRASRRIMSKLEHEITVEGVEHINTLNRRTRFDLFLFFKESLVNISRHAGASKFSTHLRADAKNIRLVVSDNGDGIPDSKGDGVPSSLRRRARILKGKVTVDCPESGGTRVTLDLPIRKLNRIRP